MSDQLDILALEPFYGGFRREMLETLVRTSRHRWTILKLPPRRLERRLATAARWFAEQLARHSAGHFDLLFTSEALNLADLYRFAPKLARKPAVVFFHSHELGDDSPDQSQNDYANLSSASASTEIWFSSRFGCRDFFSSAQAIVGRDAELRGQDILPKLAAKARVVSPPVDTGEARALATPEDVSSASTASVFVDSSGIDLDLLNGALQILSRRSVTLRLNVLGPTNGFVSDAPLEAVAATDTAAISKAMLHSTVFVSASPGCSFDAHAVRAMSLDRPTLVPRSGSYIELVPQSDQASLLYPVDPDALANALQRALISPETVRPSSEMLERLNVFEALTATRAIDQRLRALVDQWQT